MPHPRKLQNYMFHNWCNLSKTKKKNKNSKIIDAKTNYTLMKRFCGSFDVVRQSEFTEAQNLNKSYAFEQIGENIVNKNDIKR